MHCLLKSLAVAAFAAPMALGAQQVIDQNSPTQNGIYAQFDQQNLAQSFTPGHSNVSGAGVYLYNGIGSGASILTINLWTLLPNAFGAVQLASGTTAFSANNQWVDVFWSPVATTVGQTYYLEFKSSVDTYAISGSDVNSYVTGQLFANLGFQTSQQYNRFPTTVLCPSDGTGDPPYTVSFQDFDYTFRTFSTVPEPGTVSLMAGGLLVLVGFAKRRRGANSANVKV